LFDCICSRAAKVPIPSLSDDGHHLSHEEVDDARLSHYIQLRVEQLLERPERFLKLSKSVEQQLVYLKGGRPAGYLRAKVLMDAEVAEGLFNSSAPRSTVVVSFRCIDWETPHR
jgi:hypothetical protein